MKSGLLIVGLNGAGKTTLGRALAEALGWFRMDVEDYYFPPADNPGNPFAVCRSEDEVRRRMLADARRHERFVLSSVSGDWGEAFAAHVGAVVALSAPPEIRLARIDRRSAERFGSRVAPGGDMYEQERRFRDMAAARTERIIDDWLGTVRVPVLRLDAARPTEESLRDVLDWLESLERTEESPAHT